ncbi:MAG: hypothetical protein WD738_23565 [Pirellulales bacterium]
MDGIDKLKSEALARRNATILAAKREYQTALKEIAALQRALGIKRPGRPRKIIASDYSGLKATTVAVEILMEGKPMTLAELTVEVRRRGCRSLDDPRAVAHAINSGLNHHRRRFKRKDGRWSVV